MNDFESRLRSALDDETIDISARSTLAEDMVVRGSRIRRRRRVAGGVATVAILAAIVPIWHTVDTSGSQIPPTSPTVTPTTTPTTPLNTRPASSLPRWGTVPVNVEASASQTPLVTAIRSGQHGSFDRVVVDLTGPISGYRVSYTSGLTFESGEAVPLQGNAFLAIRLAPAAAHTDAGQSVFTGAKVQDYGMPVLLGGALTEDFEGVVTFGLALSKHADFRVFALSSPTRLVVDVRH